MAKKCFKCGFVMGTFQEVTTFAGNVARRVFGPHATPKDKSFVDRPKGVMLGALRLTAGPDNTLFRERAQCPKCEASGRWVDL